MKWLNKLLGKFTDHPAETANPQTYLQHAKFASGNSFKLIWAGIAGVIHAIYPPLFPFYTSTRVIRSFKKLVESGRHNDELLREFGATNLNEMYKYGLTAAMVDKDDPDVKGQ
jgi:hypothetical protein